jgi:hypothetical protein
MVVNGRAVQSYRMMYCSTDPLVVSSVQCLLTVERIAIVGPPVPDFCALALHTPYVNMALFDRHGLRCMHVHLRVNSSNSGELLGRESTQDRRYTYQPKI